VKILSIALALVAAALASCGEPKQTGATATNAIPLPEAPATPYLARAQPRLQTMKLYMGAEELTAELAMKPVEIYTGMMWRTNMPEGTAMLFVFADATPRSFYMRNTYVPLSIGYITPDGVLEEIYDMQPRNENSVPSKSENIQFVLEVPQGWFKRHNISTGMVVRTQFGDMKRSFSFHHAP